MQFGMVHNYSSRCLQATRRRRGYTSLPWLQIAEFWPAGGIIEKYISLEGMEAFQWSRLSEVGGECYRVWCSPLPLGVSREKSGCSRWGDAVGIGLDRLCGVFQHQDALILVVNTQKILYTSNYVKIHS